MLLVSGLIVGIFALGAAHFHQNVSIIAKSRSAFLEKYKFYSDAVVMHFNIPSDISFASLKFVADEMDLSIFGCSPKDITMFVKYGSPPVINPEGAKFPKKFYFTGRPEAKEYSFKSDKKEHYINMSSPQPGNYFVALFNSYTNPNEDGIKQDGLTAECYTFVDFTLSTDKPKIHEIITNKQEVIANLNNFNKKQCYKFFIDEASSIDRVRLKLTLQEKECSALLEGEEDCSITVRIQAENVPSLNNSLMEFNITSTTMNKVIKVVENTWYYICYNYENNDDNNSSITSVIQFTLNYYSNILPLTPSSSPSSSIYGNSKLKTFTDNGSYVLGMNYREYELMRDSSSEIFKFSFDLQQRNEDEPSYLAWNLTSEGFSSLKFALNDFVDNGGTLQFIAAFKPKVIKSGSRRIIERMNNNYTVVFCVKNNQRMVPEETQKCVFNDVSEESGLILNKTHTNSSLQIPYPEGGNWFITAKLFCDKCEPCLCPKSCKNDFEACLNKCEKGQSQSQNENCVKTCRKALLSDDLCGKNCDCDGPCKRQKKDNDLNTCNVSLIFDLTSTVCISNSCGKNGRCTFMVADGFVYTSCMCSNNYRGWDCSDDSLANSYLTIVIELLLLVLSNLAFLPAVYIGYKRGYYVETMVYFCTCFFSTFYHSCDAGENIISFCIARLNVLQFSDFYVALLAIWVTLVAMAHLSEPLKPLAHILGAILLAFGTTYNKTSLWVFLLPALVGAAIILISWFYRYKTTKRLFPSRRYLIYYLPSGLTIVGIGLICYSFLQTKNNYKYLHSLWHILMAIGIIILLPNDKVFLPEYVETCVQEDTN